jgi:hypothetical protein
VWASASSTVQQTSTTTTTTTTTHQKEPIFQIKSKQLLVIRENNCIDKDISYLAAIHS